MCGPCSDGTYWDDQEPTKDESYDPDTDPYNWTCGRCGESGVFCRCNTGREGELDINGPDYPPC